MTMSWKHCMLVELLFLTTEGGRAVIGMVQVSGCQYQAIAVYTDLKSTETKALGFYGSMDKAKEIVETEARREWRELYGAGADDDDVVIDANEIDLKEAHA